MHHLATIEIAPYATMYHYSHPHPANGNLGL